MSESATYRAESLRRRELFLARVRSTTAAFVERYRRILEEVRRDGLELYAVEEIAQLENAINGIESLLATDPEAARTRSQSIAAEVHGLPRLARDLRAAAEAAALRRAQELAEAKERARADLEAAWRTALTDWNDALARHLAHGELSDLRRRILSEEEGLTAASIQRELDALRDTSRKRAAAFREQRAAEARKHGQAEAAREALGLASSVEKSSPSVTAAAREALANADAQSPEVLAARLADAARAADDAVVNEDVRLEIVRAVNDSLRNAGFLTQAPYRRVEGGRDEVVIHASRPAGSQAEFRVALDGYLVYKFDHYQGSACRKDIDSILPSLQDVYGIKLSDKRVTWSNPDDLDRTARTRPSDNEEGSHGR